MLKRLAQTGVAIIVFLGALWWLTPAPAPTDYGKPWQVKVDGQGKVSVFGLRLSETTLAQAKAHFNDKSQLAYIVDTNQQASVELFYPSIRLSGITGKLVLAAPTTRHLSTEKANTAPSGSKFLPLSDWQGFGQEIVQHISFLPSKNLSASLVREVFGTPEEVIAEGAHIQHFLYPDLGVDVALFSEGKDAIQYINPEKFTALRAPLLAEK